MVAILGQRCLLYLAIASTVDDRIVADRKLGSAVMYAPGKILYAGGGDPPTSSAEVIDLNDASPSWRSVPGMQFARRQMNATILADGQVLVTNGTRMTPREVEAFGSALLSSSYPCAFVSWKHGSHLAGSSMKSAMKTLRRKAESRAQKSCRS